MAQLLSAKKRVRGRGGANAYANAEANTMAIGALEIAKASLLAHRWGVNICGLETRAIVKEPPDPAAQKRDPFYEEGGIGHDLAI